jgi:diaminopropionate ammonia-lyase
LVAVPVGVGSLAQACVAHYRAAEPTGRATVAVLAVEPDTAACLLASLRAGRPVTVPTANTIMAGLNCGTLSSIAWPFFAGGLDAAVAVTDDAPAAPPPTWPPRASLQARAARRPWQGPAPP